MTPSPIRPSRRGWLKSTLAASLASAGALAGAAPAVRRWSVGPFRISTTEGGELGPLRDADLGELQSELRRVLGVRPCEETIDVWIGASKAEHRRAVARVQPDAPYRRALFVKEGGRSLVLAYRHDELATDLRHEATHALLHADLPMIPLWLDEGIATYFQEPPGARAAGGVHLAALKRDLRLGFLTPIAELEGRRELRDLSARDYRFAWGWTHFLLHGPRPATQALWATLDALRRWQPPGPISARLATLARPAEASLREHFLTAWPARLRQARSGAGRAG